MEPGLIKLCPAQPDHGWIDPNTPTATFWTLQCQQAECKHLTPEFTTRLLSQTGSVDGDFQSSPVNISRTASGCGAMFLGQSEAQHRISVLLLKV